MSKKLVTNLLSIFGLFLIVLAIVYSLYKLNDLQKTIDEKKAEVDSLDSEAVELMEMITQIKSGPLEKLIEPKAIATQLIGKKAENGKDLYAYTLWIKVPQFRKKEILEVIYHFNHISTLQKERISREPSNGFAVSYTGWAPYKNIPIEIITKDESKTEITMNMAEQIYSKKAFNSQ